MPKCPDFSSIFGILLTECHTGSHVKYFRLKCTTKIETIGCLNVYFKWFKLRYDEHQTQHRIQPLKLCLYIWVISMHNPEENCSIFMRFWLFRKISISFMELGQYFDSFQEFLAERILIAVQNCQPEVDGQMQWSEKCQDYIFNSSTKCIRMVVCLWNPCMWLNKLFIHIAQQMWKLQARNISCIGFKNPPLTDNISPWTLGLV